MYKRQVYENLVNFDNGEIVPGLAESWEYNDDQTELTFHLRQGVTFHNGEPFNAEAVKTNLEHKQSNPSFYTLKGITDITEMEIVDDYTITFHYDHPFYAYLQDFCWSDAVSYTHLDVYKRQRLFCSDDDDLACCTDWCVACGMPVLYERLFVCSGLYHHCHSFSWHYGATGCSYLSDG